MTKTGMVVFCIIEAVLGLFIGVTAVYAIAKGDVYYGGACMIATVMTAMTLLAGKYINSIMKDED